MCSVLQRDQWIAALALTVIVMTVCPLLPAAAQPGGGPPAPEGYTVLSDPLGPEVTIRTRFSLGSQEGPLHLTLAGLGASASTPPASLALTVEGRTSGWFGFVGHLRLESASGWLPGGLAEAPQHASPGTPYLSTQHLTLKNVALAPGPIYEAILSYNGATGLTSVALRNVTSSTTLYEGHLHILAVEEPQYPGFFGSEGRVEPASERIGLHMALQGEVELNVIREGGKPRPLRAARAPGSARDVVDVYSDEPIHIALSGIGPGLPGALRLIAAAIEAVDAGTPPSPARAWVLHTWRDATEEIAQIPAGALAPGLYRFAAEYFESDYDVVVAEGGIRVIDGRIHAELTLEHNQPWESGGRMSGELVVLADRDLDAVEMQVTAAPDGGVTPEKVVWNQRLDLRKGESVRIPLSFTAPVSGLPQVFRVALAGEASERLVLQPGYHVPRAFYVSPQGDDGWTGHLPEPSPSARPGTAGPFRTIGRAQRAIRDLKAAGRLQGPVTVYLRGGTYYLSEPLTFTPVDSGSEGAPITYTAYPGEKPVLSGGLPITEWKRRGSPVWAGQLPLPPQGAGGIGRSLRTLRVGDTWATLARYPNADAQDPLYGGWLFAQWWGEPWERGAFNVAVGNLHNAGDRLEWDVQVPADGEYHVWVRYSHNMSAWGIQAMDERTTLQVGDGTPLPLRNLPDTGGWGNFRWTLAGKLQIPAGEQRLIWKNVGGGGYNLDALALSNDPKWHPESGIQPSTESHHYRLVKEPGAHVVMIQGEAAARAAGKEITIPQFPQITGNMNLLRFPRGTFPAWSDWSGAEVHIFPAWGWVNAVVGVTGVDAQIETLHVDSSQDIRPGNRFFVANVREALDSPGEWYFDRSRGEVLYWPREDDFPGGVEVVAALLDRLIVLRGDGPGRFVEHIRFRGLTFTDTDYTAPGGYYSHADAAVWLSQARHIAIEDSHFVNLGGYAVRLDQRSHRNEIVGNTIRRMGQGGVIMLGDTASQPYDNLIAANEMTDLGLIYKHVAGVYVTTGSGNRIVHNRIHRVPRYGISLKSYSLAASSHNNLVEFNEIVNSNLETNDTGAIETLGRDQKHSGNIIRFNWIENVVGVASTESGEIRTPYFTWGIYLDDYSSGTLVYGNIVSGTVLGAICIHGGQDNVVENNIFLEGSERQITLQPRDAFMTRNAFRRNIVVYSNPDALLWYSYSHTWAPERLSEVDANLYWHAGGLDLSQTTRRITPEGAFAAWQAAGFDRGSRIADPLLLGREREDFGLAPDSPAWALGFERIPVERIGPEGYDRSQ